MASVAGMQHPPSWIAAIAITLLAVGCLNDDDQIAPITEVTCPTGYVMRDVDRDTGEYVCVLRWGGGEPVIGMLDCPTGSHAEIDFPGSKSARCVHD